MSDYNDPFTGIARSVTIGFDDILRRLSDLGASEPNPRTGFPPYDIKKTGDNTYVIEMAVAGFGKDDIEITLEEDVLTIKGNIQAESDSSGTIYKGIAKRNFTRKFTLAETVQVLNSALSNGMLKIFLERVIPEEKKPKKIEINDSPITLKVEDSKSKK